jgi:tetratricopeptide (TPR) repeat protein
MKNRKSKSFPSRRPSKPKGRELASQLSRRQVQAVLDAQELIENENYEEAEGILLTLNSKGTFPPVVELLADIYLEKGHFQKALDYATTLIRVTPRMPEARLKYANAAMYMGYATIAMFEFQEYIKQCPHDPDARDIQKLILVLSEEVQKRTGQANFPEGAEGIRLQVLHEESLAALARNRFDETISKCNQLLSIAPHFCSSRNNLALALWHSGKIEAALGVAQETTTLVPDNRFAAILLAKLRWLSGQLNRPEALIQQLLDTPPDNQDAVVLAAEYLAMSGCDQELVKFMEAVPANVLKDVGPRALCLHYEAYGRCRLNQKREAERLWERSIDILPEGTEAAENLAELRNPVENAPWPCSVEQWGPMSIFKAMKENSLHIPKYLKRLLPIFLDRGDAMMRNLAVAIYLSDQSEESLEALKHFSFSSRGSDALRNKVLMNLHEMGKIDKGPHPFYSCGKLIEIELQQFAIHYESNTDSNLSPKQTALIEQAVQANYDGDLDLTEQCYEILLQEVPHNPSARFNLATIWLNRGDKSGMTKALAVFEELHQQDPDYIFAAMALAEFHSLNGNHAKALEYVKMYSGRTRFHPSEAKSLLMTQACILHRQGEVEKACNLVDMLDRLLPNDPEVTNFRSSLERPHTISKLKRMFSRRK